MGYNLIIGEMIVHKNPEDGIYRDCISFGAKEVHFYNAPSFGEPTDYTNQRWSSYIDWINFLRNTNLYSFFFDQNERILIGGHPGVRLVTEDLCKAVQDALEEYKTQFPNAVAQFEGDDSNGVLCRLIWLDFWLRWAFENCETPVLANS
jgi:hypothetical protein